MAALRMSTLTRWERPVRSRRSSFAANAAAAMVVCAAVPTRNEDGSAGSLPVRSTVSSAASGCPAARQMSLRTCFAVDAVIPGKRKPLRWRASLRCNGMNRGGELGLPPPPRAGEGWEEGELVLVACPPPPPPPPARGGRNPGGRRAPHHTFDPPPSRFGARAPQHFSPNRRDAA